jgi:murein DD-endopeptidase MepM/ murein hydrolase activator NlpD
VASTKLHPENTYAPFAPATEEPYGDGTPYAPGGAFAGGADPSPGEWNPTADSVRVRGRHRVARRRGGVGRSGAVLGVGMMAAVGAGGIASASDAPAPVSMPDLDETVAEHLPQAADLPVVGSLVSGGAAPAGADTANVAADAPLTPAVATLPGEGVAPRNAGDALADRLLAQAEQQQSDAHRAEIAQTAAAAASAPPETAARKAEAAREAAEEAARKKAEAERRARLAAAYTLPVASFTLTAGFGQAGDLWSADHTGQDFAAPTGTPVRAVHSGTVTSAGWAGSYGYRIVLKTDDGTELWFCHLSSMSVSAGQHVDTKDVIGNVGATGNVTGPHLHLEVRPGGGSPIDPMPWLRAKGLSL